MELYKNTINNFTNLTVGSSGIINTVVKNKLNPSNNNEQAESTTKRSPQIYKFPEYNYNLKDNTNVIY